MTPRSGMNATDRTPVPPRLLAAACAMAAVLAPRATAGAREEVARVIADTGDRILVEVAVTDTLGDTVAIEGRAYVRVVLDGEPPLTLAGAPELPSVTRSLRIPDDAHVSLTVTHAEYREIEDIDVAPSRGVISRQVDPADVPYTFGPEYETDAFYPGVLADLGEPYILRDTRGIVLDVYPYQYNPVTRTLRIYEILEVEVAADGPGEINVLRRTGRPESRAFSTVTRHHFLNADPDRYPPSNEEGEMLIICHDDWMAEIEPLVQHKNGIGIPTTAVAASAAGSSVAGIQSTIQDAYDDGNLAFVLLVGDVAQIPSPTSSGGASDPSYAKLDGSDDYPDILIGRFSAESAADVATQVERTIAYETMPATEQDWFWRGLGIGSTEGPGDDNEMDWEHIDRIRDDLLAYGYTVVDQVYDPGATAGDVRAALEDGRGIVSYCGHGSMTSWGTTGFDVGDVAALHNPGMLPFIHSVACNTGEFNHGTCFGEAWLRATSGGQPTGAVAAYMSSISQSWNPPMAAQDETVDLLVAEDYVTVGALFFAGSGRMMDEYGWDGTAMFDTWHLFGDPSLRVVGAAAPTSGLAVSPGDAFDAAGDAGGPFAPSSITYTIENLGDHVIDVEMAVAEGWVEVTPTAASIAPGETVEVTAAWTPAVDELIEGLYLDEISFTNTTDHEGDATRSAALQVGEPRLQVEWTLDEDPGWDTQGQWAWGPPLGGGGEEHGFPDPTSGYTGANVYGYNLAGDYPDDLPEQHLTTGPIDLSNVSQVTLRFMRWLGVERSEYDHAYVRVSTDGEHWTDVWENDVAVTVEDDQWRPVELDLSAVADHQPQVFLRWTMGATDGGWTYCGWNIDDIEIWGLGYATCWDDDGDGHDDALCGGDDCDDGDAGVHPGAAEGCEDPDLDCDGVAGRDDPACQAGGDDDGVPMGDGGISTAAGCQCRQADGTPGAAAILAALGLVGASRRRRRGGDGHAPPTA